MIEIRNLTKSYGRQTVIDDLSFDVQPGMVTGFLGPNGSGKSTTMRCILGLDRPDKGEVRVNGRPFADVERPASEIGALLDARAFHPQRSAYRHLLALAQSNGLARRRVEEVLDLVGLSGVAKKRAGSFSLGMGQRLGIAAALLGDPRVALFDEPVNGLDPDGILWVRGLMKELAAEGRTVLVSSHLLSEMALTADHIVVIGRGKLLADSSVREFVGARSQDRVVVRSGQPAHLAGLLREAGSQVTQHADGALHISGADTAEIGELAAANGVAVHELYREQGSLEEAFAAMTKSSLEYHVHSSQTS